MKICGIINKVKKDIQREARKETDENCFIKFYGQIMLDWSLSLAWEMQKDIEQGNAARKP